MKKLVSLFLFVAVFILSTFSKAFAYKNEEHLHKYNQDYFDEILNMSNFKSKKYKSLFVFNNNLNYGKYPEYFGGNYIKDDKLYINIIKEYPKFKVLNSLEYKIFEQIYDKIELKYVDYSMNYLENVYNILDNYFSGRVKYIEYDVKFSIDVENNRINFQIEDISENKIKDILRIVGDRNIFSFTNLLKTKNQASVYPGHQISSRKVITKAGASSSLGYAVSYNGKNGLVMSGHGSDVGHFIFSKGKKIGITRKKQNRATIDASYVEITDKGFSVNNKIEGHKLKSAAFNPVVGSRISKVGFATGTTVGYVKSINSSWTDKTSGIYYSNMSESNYKSASGDSGGLVYFKIPNSLEYLIVGIHKDGGNGIAHYTKASEINRIFGLKVK
ncbi:chymotrypsin family serine protease [Helcococcus kunzii]|uniref:hypothetical protein n=1 Tax=Helcococcus kunzii TaxID=40091 RepID=UPI001BB0B289|nr:hypothetical protein [Helcococcus kunzii]QUY64134.1 hypothetical protein GUI37_00840 [Helcococcus kunzii]